ncbi:MAG TPA: copper resistance protein B, partial [Gammaproteobacteria bacterium]|nr:copper resistance protein B [Gammaproteobacteria bacterium]
MKHRGVAVAVGALALMAALPSAAGEPPGDWPSPVHDNVVLSKIMLDRLELRHTDAGNLAYWEGQAWVGGDINKLWLKSEGGVLKGRTEEADLEALYSRAMTAFWDLQAGVRHDFGIGDKPAREWAAIGLKGLAPYRFDVDATAYVGTAGRTAARVKAEYEVLLTQRLILMPELEFNAYGKEDRARGLGSGLSDVGLALRLRYEIRREFAPYAGVRWTRKFGGTADFARQGGEAVQDTQWVVGL